MFCLYVLRIFVCVSFSCPVVGRYTLFTVIHLSCHARGNEIPLKRNWQTFFSVQTIFPLNEFCFYIIKYFHDPENNRSFSFSILSLIQKIIILTKIDLAKVMKLLHKVHIQYWNVKRLNVDFPQCFFSYLTFWIPIIGMYILTHMKWSMHQEWNAIKYSMTKEEIKTSNKYRLYFSYNFRFPTNYEKLVELIW